MDYSGSGAVRCYTDGASRGNPGPSAYAFVIYSDGELLHEESAFIGTATNNIAEYHAVIHGLQWLSGITSGPVELFSDSELVIKQLTGIYSVKKLHLRESLQTNKTSRTVFPFCHLYGCPEGAPTDTQGGRALQQYP